MKSRKTILGIGEARRFSNLEKGVKNMFRTSSGDPTYRRLISEFTFRPIYPMADWDEKFQ